jgi:AcrR family transcriptional regulator
LTSTVDPLTENIGGRAHASDPRTTVTEPLTTDRRASILFAALELFAVRGYRATTMADLGEQVGIRGPSIYKHFTSKQQILSEITFNTMDRLTELYALAVSGSDDVTEQLRLAIEAHVRYHALHRFEAFVGTREVKSLEEPARSALLARRDHYERGFRELIEKGHSLGRFNVPSSRLASYAILDMGMGVAVWFREDGPLSEEQVALHYGLVGLRIVGAK